MDSTQQQQPTDPGTSWPFDLVGPDVPCQNCGGSEFVRQTDDDNTTWHCVVCDQIAEDPNDTNHLDTD